MEIRYSTRNTRIASDNKVAIKKEFMFHIKNTKERYLCLVIGRIKNSAFTKIFWGFMGLYLLNISVDPSDLNPENTSEVLSFNEQESIVEIVVEKLLGFEDAIAEYDNPETEDHNTNNNVKIKLLLLFAAEYSSSESIPEIRKQKYHQQTALLTKGHYQLDTPPPII